MKAHQENTPLPFLDSPSLELRRAEGRRGTSRFVGFALLLVGSLPVPSQVTTVPSMEQGAPTPQTAPAPQPTDGKDVPAAPAAPTSVPLRPPQVPAAMPNGSGAGSSMDNLHYVIGADDNLQITVWREPTLSGVLPVRPDGMISLVLIGDLKAAGKTPTQLSSDITQQLKKYIQDPSVTVAVTAVNSQRIFMVGEVGHVGPVSLSPGMTPLQAVSAAGGPSPYANLKRIYILRGLGAKQQKIPFNYKQALKGDNRQDITLQAGDTIVVP